MVSRGSFLLRERWRGGRLGLYNDRRKEEGAGAPLLLGDWSSASTGWLVESDWSYWGAGC